MTETLHIETMSYGPDAIAHQADGRVVFVSNAVPGDTVEVEISEERPAFARGHAINVIDPSPDRVKPEDPALVESIEPWSILSYEAQVAAKAHNVEEALIRVGGVAREEASHLIRPLIPAKRPYGYRNKIELGACLSDAGKFALGFAQHGTDRIQPVTSCAIAVPPIQKMPHALAGALRYLAGNEDLGIMRVGIRASLRTKSLEIALWTPPSSFPRAFAAKMLEESMHATSIVRVIADPGSERHVKRVETLGGDGRWEEELYGLRFSVSAPSFFQVNTSQAEKLIQLVLDAVKVEEDIRVADVFAGCGTFSLPLADAGAQVVAIELAGSAVKDLRRNADANDLYVDAICDDAVRALGSLESSHVVVVDPPRCGLDKRVVRGIAKAAPERVVYVSCDPQTLARDAARFRAQGYALSQVTPVDMFPQTYHVECVAVFDH